LSVWKIEWSQTAFKEIYGLERGVAERIVAKLEAAALEPVRYFTRLVGRDDYKLRIGDYRLFALLLHGKSTIFVRNVRHRKDAYK
jgi:mRNA interferase RelE/StbE